MQLIAATRVAKKTKKQLRYQGSLIGVNSVMVSDSLVQEKVSGWTLNLRNFFPEGDKNGF
jgi:hypothetical protein